MQVYTYENAYFVINTLIFMLKPFIFSIFFKVTMNEFLDNKKLPKGDSSAFKCFLHCLFTKYGWMDEEGGFLLHDIKVSLEETNVQIDSLEFILYKCTAIQSVDKCERTFIFMQCFWKKIAEVKSFFFIEWITFFLNRNKLVLLSQNMFY